ncbi:hypothetical protein, partial [Klebsiella pneumoniae]
RDRRRSLRCGGAGPPPRPPASRAYAWLAHHLSSPSSSEEYAS